MVVIDGEGCDYSIWVETLYEAEGAVEPCDFVHRGRVRRGGAAWAVTVFQLSRDYVEIQCPQLNDDADWFIVSSHQLVVSYCPNLDH